MPDAPVPDRPRTALFCTALVTAPLLEVVEALISPLANGTTEQDLASIAAAPDRFAVSVLFGIVATFLLLPVLLGLAHRCSERTPRLAFAAGIAVGLVAMSFAGIRALQGAQLALATHLPLAQAARIFDAVPANPIGAVFAVVFLSMNLVGIVVLGIALLRSRRVPIGSVVLLFLFPVADFASRTEIGVACSHLILTASFAWMAVAFLRSAPARRPARARADDVLRPA